MSNKKQTPSEARPAPVCLTVTIDRESGRFGIAHNILGGENGGADDLRFLIEALGSVLRDLNNTMVEVRVAAALNGQAKDPEPMEEIS